MAIIKRFEFSSKLQRMSVIVKSLLDNKLCLYAKGSPERIRELCLDFTIPDNFNEILQIYTECGYRVLGVAHKNLNISYIKA